MANVDTTKLEAVNTMLHMVGGATVNSLTDSTSEDVAIAIRVLDEVSREIQRIGWHWNTDLDQTIDEDSDGKHPWQDDWIRFDTARGNHTGVDLVRRGDFLWDRLEGTYEFSIPKLKGDIVRFLDFDAIPEAARAYIMIRAGRLFLSRSEGDEERVGFSVDDERRSWVALLHEESEQSDANIFSTGVAPWVRNRPGGTGLRGNTFFGG